MSTLLKKLSSHQDTLCVTLILPTHRTAPDNQQDRINLKNLVTAATAKLHETNGTRDISGLLDNLKKTEEIDIQHNKEGLVVFISEHVFEYERLLFSPEQRFIIDSNFATRDLIRQMNYEDNYYVMTLSNNKVRLLEGSTEYLHDIKTKHFPADNNVYSTDRIKTAQGNTHDKHMEEFFNRQDKLFLSEHYAAHPGHLVLAGTESNIQHYQTIADKKNIILTTIEGSFDDTSAHIIAEKAWPQVRKALAERRKTAIEQLDAAGTGMLSTDLADIWQKIQEGRGGHLYVEKDFYQAGAIAGNTLVTSLNGEDAELANDVVDEIIEATIQFGGIVHFMDNGSMEKYGRIALVLRY